MGVRTRFCLSVFYCFKGPFSPLIQSDVQRGQEKRSIQIMVFEQVRATLAEAKKAKTHKKESFERNQRHTGTFELGGAATSPPDKSTQCLNACAYKPVYKRQKDHHTRPNDKLPSLTCAFSGAVQFVACNMISCSIIVK